MKKKNTILLIFLVIISIFTSYIPFNTSCRAATTLHVGVGQDYSTIQSAIDAANSSDIIYVHSGTYNEQLVIDKIITLIGEEQSTTKISGSGDHTIEISANSITISEFTIENTGGSYAGIILLSSSNCEITNNIIKNGGNGVYIVTSNTNTIQDNSISENNIGIYISNSNSNTIKSNQIFQNNANGVFLTSTSNANILYLNDFSENTQSNARDQGSNTWSYSSQGNYWDDYNDYDNNDDGIGDNPYDISGGSNQDLFPLGDFLSGSSSPVAYIDSINPNPSTGGQTVQFSGHGTDDGSIIGWEWTSNLDGSLSESEDFSSSELSLGTHVIKYRVKDNENQWSLYDQETLIINQDTGENPGLGETNQIPIAEIISINPSALNYGDQVYLHGIGTDSDGHIIAYSWRSSIDGNICPDSSCTILDLSIGSHIIYFKVQDDDGEWSTEVSSSIVVNQIENPQNNDPIPDTGGPYEGAVNETIFLDASGSSDPDSDTITSYSWNLGDGTTKNGKTIEHTYSSIGTFTVSLTITDSNGATASSSTFVIISSGTSTNPTEQNNTEGSSENEPLFTIPGFELINLLSSSTFLFYLYRKKIKK